MNKSIKILLAEDEPSLGQIIKESLETRNFEVLLCTDGEQAYNVYKAENPLLLVLDVMMPKKNGYEVCTTFKKDERTSHITVVLLTAKTSSEDKIVGLSTQADDYITKPFDSGELLARVKTQMMCQNLKKRLKEQNKELLEITRQSEEIEHITHHDLKGLLSPIISSPHLIKKSGPLTVKQIKHLDNIEKAGLKMLKLITRTIGPILSGVYKDDQE